MLLYISQIISNMRRHIIPHTFLQKSFQDDDALCMIFIFGKLERLARLLKSGQLVFRQRLVPLLQSPGFHFLNYPLFLCSALKTDNASTGCGDEVGIFVSLEFPMDPATSHSHQANSDLLLSIYAYTHNVGRYWVS
jgi:hypothetical protein